MSAPAHLRGSARLRADFGWTLGLWAATRGLLAIWLAAGAGAGDGVMPLTFAWTERLLAGDSPYDPVGVAYPPLAMLLFVLPALGAADAAAYAATFVALVLAADVAGLVVAAAAQRGGRRHAALAYTLAVPAAGPVLLLWRYDLLPAVAHLAAAMLALRGRRAASWAALGVGVALKPYLAVALPLWGVWEARERGGAAAARGLALAAAPSAAAATLLAPVAGRDLALPYLFQLRRGLNVESVPAALVAELGPAEAVFSAGCLCWERTGPAAAWLGPASTAALVVVVLLLTVWVWRRPDVDRVVGASAAAVLALVVASPVFSPQYVLWPLPVLALLGGRAPLVLAAAAAAVAAVGYPHRFEALAAYDDVGRLLIWGRAGLLAAALAVTVHVTRRQSP